MDQDHIIELIGRILATLESLNKNDDVLDEKIDDLRKSVRSNCSAIYTRLNDVEVRTARLEQQLKSMKWLLTLLFGGFVSLVIYTGFTR